MPVNTRSKTRSGQPPDPVTSPRDGERNRPRKIVRSRQGQAVVTRAAGEGSPPISVVGANGTQQSASFTISKCVSKRCLTCPKLILSKSFTSNVTKKTYTIINHSGENISCHTRNLNYLLVCSNCYVQYVGETALPLHKRINIHRTAKQGCEYFIKHYRNDCVGSSFFIQILEVFQGSGYINGQLCTTAREKRLEREDFWAKTLRTVYPYGLNDKVRNIDNNKPIGLQLPSISRTSARAERPRNNFRSNINNNADEILKKIYHIVENDIQNAYFHIRIILNSIKKKVLKQIATRILYRYNNSHDLKENLDQYYFYMLDIIDSKLYRSTTATKKTSPKNVCVINFQNKPIEHIKLSKILNEPDVISQLPMELQNKENRPPIITYKLSSTIRNKIFNYKDTVNSIYFDDEISFALNTDPCQCSKSPFIDSHHKHVITGDLRIVENAKLRKLLTKGPNYREPRSINFNKAVTEITAGLENCIENLANKTKYDKKRLTSGRRSSWKRFF